MATIDTLLSLERARFELRVPDDDTSQDVLLSGLIASAISSLSKDTNAPLLDSIVETKVHLSGRSGIQIYDPYLKSITSISYQPTSENSVYGLFPKKVIPNRCTITPGERKGAFVIRPRGYQSWPDAAYNRFRIEGIVGLANDDPALAAYRSATVLLFRSLYDGVPILREDSAYERIIRPLGRKDLSTFNLIGLVISAHLSVNMGTKIGLVSDLLVSPPVRLPEYLGVNMGTSPGIIPVLAVHLPVYLGVNMGTGPGIIPVLAVVLASPIRVRVGWSQDIIPTADELTASSITDTVVVPVQDPNNLLKGGGYLLVWRSDAAGGDPTGISFDGAFDMRGGWGAAADLSIDNVPGKVIVSDYDLLSRVLAGTSMEVT